MKSFKRIKYKIRIEKIIKEINLKFNKEGT